MNPRSGSVDSALLFGRATDSDDPEAIVDPDALTDPRLRDEVGDIELVPPENRINGPGTTVITATFTLLNPNGRRFPDGTGGLFHAANDLGTAIAGTKHHREQFPSATAPARMEIDMRNCPVALNGDMWARAGFDRVANGCAVSSKPKPCVAGSPMARTHAG